MSLLEKKMNFLSTFERCALHWAKVSVNAKEIIAESGVIK